MICELNYIKLTLREATLEEAIVMNYKILNWEYYSEDVKWDSTKISFPLKIDNMLKFTTRKIANE